MKGGKGFYIALCSTSTIHGTDTVTERILLVYQKTEELGLKNDEIKVCVGNKSIEDGLLKDRLQSSKKYDITATPTIYFNGKKYTGDLTLEALELKINSLLN